MPVLTAHEQRGDTTNIDPPEDGLAPVLMEVDSDARPTMVYILWAEADEADMRLSAELVEQLTDEGG